VVDPEVILSLARQHRLTVRLRLRLRVGEHVVAGTVLGWAWPPAAGDQSPDPTALQDLVDRAVRIGFERTLEQDPALEIRQLGDMACKALSPAVNDPYTAVQAVDHLSVIFCALAVRPLGETITGDHALPALVIVPGRRFGDYLSTMCGLIRRYGSAEPTLSVALLRLLDDCAATLPTDSPRWDDLTRQAGLILADATRQITQPADLLPSPRPPPTSRPAQGAPADPTKRIINTACERPRPLEPWARVSSGDGSSDRRAGRDEVDYFAPQRLF